MVLLYQCLKHIILGKYKYLHLMYQDVIMSRHASLCVSTCMRMVHAPTCVQVHSKSSLPKCKCW